jgi:hypothetical protein
MFCKNIVENIEKMDAHMNNAILAISLELVKKQLDKNNPFEINLK